MTGHPLQRRRDLSMATKAAFHGKPFRYGLRDCVRMGAFHLRQFGYRVKLPPSGSYRSARSARKALNDRGFVDLPAALDAIGLARIAPAAALIGDLIMLEAEGDLGGSLNIYVGNGRVLGYHQDCAGADFLQPLGYVAAWRVELLPAPSSDDTTS